MDDIRFKLNRNKGTTEALSFEEWIRLKDELKKARNKELYPMVCFSLLGGGRRVSECLNLTWQDIDFRNNKLHVLPLKKKTDDIEHLPLNEQLKEILESLGNDKAKTAKVFKTDRKSIDKSLKLYAKKAGLAKTVSFHSLRTSFITWSLERGDSMSEILNATLHSSNRMLRYYDRTDTLKTSSIHKMRV